MNVCPIETHQDKPSGLAVTQEMVNDDPGRLVMGNVKAEETDRGLAHTRGHHNWPEALLGRLSAPVIGLRCPRCSGNRDD